jgi:hypothetical protein
MSNKNLTILAVVAVVTVVLAAVTSHLSARKPATSYKNVNLVQGFDTGKIATVILKSKDEETKITLSGGQFVVTNKDNYPALINEINGLVAEILDIKTVDLITDDPKNHTDLGVSEDNARYIVKFLDKDAKPIEGFGGIIISESNTEKQGVYVRLLGESKVYLIDGSPWPRMSGLDYIDKRLTSVEADEEAAKIKSVKVTHPDGGYTLLKKDDSEDVLLEGGIPEGKQFKGMDYKQVFTVLTDMQFTDVQKASKVEDLKFDSTYTCTLDDSTVYTLRIGAKDDKTFIEADAEYTGAKSETALVPIAAAVKFRNRHTGWVYEISSFKADNLKRKLDDLLEDIPEEKTSDAETPTTTAPVIGVPPQP